MPKLPSRWRSNPSTISRYVIAGLFVAVTFLAIKFLFSYVHTEPFVSLFVCSLMFVALRYGIGPALFATILSIAAFYYYLVTPINSFTLKPDLFTLDPDQLPRIILFAVTALFVVFLSASQRRSAESLRRSRNDLRRSKAFLAEGQRISHTGSWSWNISSGKLIWSDEHFRIFGVDPQQTEPTFELFQSRVHLEERALVQRTFDRAILEGSSFSLDYRIILPDGSVKHVHAEGRPVLTEAGNIDDFVGTTMDITERKRSEELLRNAQADLARMTRLTTIGELAASITHEINQPLNAIVAGSGACLRWLARDKPQLDEARRSAERVIRDAHRAGDIIKSVRAMAGSSPPEITELDINATIHEVLNLISSELHEHRIELEIELSTGMPPVMGDRIQLQQVIVNLLMNAVEAMDTNTNEPQTLCIRSRRDGPGTVLIAVEDSGPGVAPEIMDRLFETLFTTKPTGMGMGLSICRSIVNAHGGRLWVSPASPRGAVFQFTVPTAAQKGASD
ncbi:ATP-binding protein [Acidocella sp.]|jgi:C4-dicarboxylate-specific signal transduction histidine kinase|uniref:ATP-binding protein n=1 Tax=Acidocella sp. TaxID=50710 RepID=UPI002F418932